MENNKENLEKSGMNRRDVMKGLAAIPVLGAFAIGALSKDGYDKRIKNAILKEIDVEGITPPETGPMSGDPVRIGIIGFGIRGEQLARALGYATPAWVNEMKKNAAENPRDTRYKDYEAQENLNIKITGVCDCFDVRIEMAKAAAELRGDKPKGYRDYRKMLESPDIDAVVIATPDHSHAPICLDAIAAGKHVYVEKCMTHKIAETFALRDAVNSSKIAFQLGHQHRQTQSFLTARALLDKNVLGHISLIQANTNRNDDGGAWQYEIHEDASPGTIAWDLFLGNAPKIPFNKEHFFRWRKWWSYGTGLSGDLLTHDYDRINCLTDMGIPDSVVCSGGIYTHRDGRSVPDVMQVVMEYPEFSKGTSQEPGKEKGMTFIYSATLGNQYGRKSLLMGHDATLELTNNLMIYPDINSTRYKDFLEKGTVSTDVPMYAYDPAAKGVDAVTGATAKYFADKGLMYTYRDGKRVDSTFLHMREWLSVIRNGGKLSCGIKEGFEEAISAHMATIALRTGKRVEWDRVNGNLKNIDDLALDEIGMA